VKEVLSITAGILFFIGFIPYGWAIWRDRNKADGVKPSKTSWIIWILLDFITLAGMAFRDAVNGQIIGTVIGGVVILVLALLYGTRGWTRLDKFSLTGAGVGLGLWLLFNSPELGILMSAAVALIGSVPTWVSAIKDPSREDKLAWTLFFFSCICALIAVPRWDTLADTVQPITFTIIETVMVIILYAPRRK
jgi:hypothetical protein